MKEKYKLSEIAEKRLEESNLKIDQDSTKDFRTKEADYLAAKDNVEMKEQELNDAVNDLKIKEQAFIDAVSSVTSKEQDKGMEM